MAVNTHSISYHKIAFFARAKRGFSQGKYENLHRYFTKCLQLVCDFATIVHPFRGIILRYRWAVCSPVFLPEFFLGGLDLKRKILFHTDKLARVGLGTVALLTFLAMLLLFTESMLSTADMSIDNPLRELILFESDSMLRNSAVLILTIAFGVTFTLLIRGFPIIAKIRPWMLALVLGVWVLALGHMWVSASMSAPTQDSQIVTTAGVAAAMGDLSYVDINYFVRFPFQLGYVFWTELWARLLELNHDSYLAMEYVNVLCLALGEAALVLVTHKLFRRYEITLATTLLLAVFVQPIIFSTFLYGTSPGFCFSAWAIFFFLCYLESDRYRYILPSALCLAVAVSLKLNNMILLVAMGIILLAHLMKDKPLRRLLALCLLCLTVLILPNVGRWQYEKRLGKDFGDGIPMVSWLAMGLHDAPSAPGWYNGKYTVSNFHAHGADSEAAAEASMEVITVRLEELKTDPAAAVTFFKDKILSQWNEPTYQSLWNNQVRGQYAPKTGIAAYVCGEGEYRTKAVMDLGIQFIFCGMLLAALRLLLDACLRRKKRPANESAPYLIPLLFLGGFLYHALFEAKSQYVITYVIFMIPYAAWAFAGACSFAKRGILRFMFKRS